MNNETNTVPPDDVTATPPISANLVLWACYEEAFAYFNEKLFQKKLPTCILNLNAKGRSWGYFKKDTWRGEENAAPHHEICLNPWLLSQDGDLVFQVLVSNSHFEKKSEKILLLKERTCVKASFFDR